MSKHERITSPSELQEELTALAGRTVVGGYDRDRPDEAVHSVPNDDEPWSVADVLSGMMAGEYVHGVCVEVFGYRLFNCTVSDDFANVWRVHPPDGGRAIDALNLDQFRTASEVENYLLEGERE